MPTATPITKTLSLPDMTLRYPPSGNPPDGYVITYSASDGYYLAKPLSRILAISSPSSTPYTPINEDVVLVPGHVGTFTINLPLGQTAGKVFFIKDFAGVAAAQNIVVSGNGSNIDGTPTQTINTNYGSLEVIWSGASWAILANV
jgi:hypothetical protein